MGSTSHTHNKADMTTVWTSRETLTVFCCLLDARFILWGVGAETHEVEPAHRQRPVLEETNRDNRWTVSANTSADCSFQGNNGTQCGAKKPASFITPTHHAGIFDFMLRVTGIASLQRGSDTNTWQSALQTRCCDVFPSNLLKPFVSWQEKPVDVFTS